MFYIICFGLFLTHFVSCADKQPSLQALSNHFEILKNQCTKDNTAYYQGLSFYHSACKKAEAQLRSDTIKPHIWYRVALAQVVCSLGFDIGQNVKQFLCDKGVLKGIEKIDHCKQAHLDKTSQEWRFINFHYTLSGRFKKKNQSSQYFLFPGEIADICDKIPSYDPKMFYCSQKVPDSFNLLLQNYDDRRTKVLLNSPEKGVIFAGGPYYGILNYQDKKASIYHIDYLTQEMFFDWSSFVPWEELKCCYDSMSVSIKGIYLVLRLNLFGGYSKKYLYFKMLFDSI